MSDSSSHFATPAPSGSAAQVLLEAGLAASRANDAKGALELFQRASDAAPTWAIPHFLIGSELAAQGTMDKAEAALANAVLLDPSLHVARYQLGLLQFSSGRAAVALVTWQPISELVAGEGLPQFVRGFAALARDQLELARDEFSAGLAITGVNPSVAGDIQKVLAGIADLGNQATSAEANPVAADASAHVLVSTYDKYRLH